MSCHKKDNCFEVEEPKCSVGCDHPTDAGCVFFNLSKDQLLKLPNLGILSGTTLEYILRKIDEKLGSTTVADFSTFNLHNLSIGNEIKTLKQFSEAITLHQKNQDDAQKETSDSLLILKEDLDDLTSLIDEVDKPELSDTVVGVNNTDDIKQVLSKILTYIGSIGVASSTLHFSDSETISFSQSTTGVTAGVKLSPEGNNIILETAEGLYAAHKSTGSILKDIQDSETLKATFNTLVRNAIPCFSFDIINSNPDTIIQYINCIGDTAKATAQKDVVLSLSNVRKVVTPPSRTLSITFKGI